MSDEKQKKRRWPIRWRQAVWKWIKGRIWRPVKRQARRLCRTIMDRRFWRVGFGRIKRIAFVIVKWIALIIGFCIWPIGLLVLLYELIACLSPSLANLFSPSLADLFPSLKDFFTQKADPDEDLFSRVRVNMVILTAWVGVFFLVWRTRIADKQMQINRENHYTELFTKAVEQLGAERQGQDEKPEPALEIRIGAIYSLERLAKDSERDYGPIIETLTAYIREHCGEPKTFDGEGLVGKVLEQAWEKWLESLPEEPPTNRADIKAALTVLSRREKNRNWTSTGGHEAQPDFFGVNFQKADLSYYHRGLAYKDTNLELAYLDFATLWEVNLSGADLRLANVLGANFWRADLERANLKGANLIQANFQEANLQNTNFKGANLIQANFQNTDLQNTNLEEADLRYASLKNAVLWLAALDGANLEEANLNGANLIEANLKSANLIGAKLKGAYLVGANLGEADLQEANLGGANIEGAIFRGTNLKSAKLKGAYLVGANLGEADLQEADLREVESIGCRYSGCRFIGCESSRSRFIWCESSRY